MNYGMIKTFDVANGEGVRTTLFVSGCRNHCKNCFQPQTWDFEYGQKYTEETQQELLDSLKPSYIVGITLLGGEPFEPENQRELVKLCKKVKEEYPNKTIWAFTGYILDQDILEFGRKHCEVTDEFLSYIDVLVDGPFIQEQKNLMLAFRGSENQRVIDLKKSLKEKEVILYLE